MRKTGITTKDIALMGVMTATIEAAKLALFVVPNVELVTLLVILYSIHFGKKALPAILCWNRVFNLGTGALGHYVSLYLAAVIHCGTDIPETEIGLVLEYFSRDLRTFVWSIMFDSILLYRRNPDGSDLVDSRNPL